MCCLTSLMCCRGNADKLQAQLMVFSSVIAAVRQLGRGAAQRSHTLESD